jgi:serine/threonine protein kinase
MIVRLQSACSCLVKDKVVIVVCDGKRHIDFMRALQHPAQQKGFAHVVFAGNGYKGSVYLIFEYLEHDLCGLHERIQKAASPRAAMEHSMIKSFTSQMLQGLAHCHEHNVLHRDLKASNLLISRDGVLKLADFGLARPYVSSSGRIGELTYRVCTLWYR